MVYKNTDTQILTLLYGICKFIKMHQKQVFLCNENEIYWCLFAIKNEKKKRFLQISLYKNRFSGAEPLKTQRKIKERWCTITGVH